MYNRCGNIFDAAFVAHMSSFSQKAGLSEQTQSLLAVIHNEALLGSVETAKSSFPDTVCPIVQQLSDDSTEDEPATKRFRLRNSLPDDTVKTDCPANTESGLFSNRVQGTSDAEVCSSTFQTKDAKTLRPVTSPYSDGPMFYYCPHRRRLKNVNIPK